MATNDAHDTIKNALAEMHVLKAEVKEKEERIAEIAAFFKNYEEFEQPGRYQYGEYTLVVSPNTRVDDALAREVLSNRDYQGVTKLVIDTVRAKRILTGAQYESIQKKFAHRIGVEKQ